MSCPYHRATKVSEPPPRESPPPSSSGGKCPFAHDRASDGPVDLSESEATASALLSADRSSDKAHDAAKAHFARAYNNMAEGTEEKRKDALPVPLLTETLISRLGYTEEQIATIGDDVSLMQGTGNPHTMAALQPGEFVVDLGSGFGVDCFLASVAVGPSGRVLGIDMSEKEVQAAMQRVAHRGHYNVDFRVGDMEALPVFDGVADAVLSNGGFCLVPNKRKAFGEIFRILKPGGRLSISCTVRTQPLDKSIKWPTCMLVFMDLAQVDDIIGSQGFTDIRVDDSNRSMTVWEEVKAKAKEENPKAIVPEQSGKVGIHRGDPAYAHLKGMDMNKRFARVTVYARKPDVVHKEEK